MAADRHSEAEDAALLSDPDEIARREAENGLRQFTLVLDIIRSHVKDAERPFKLRAGPIMQLHQAALDGLHRLAGTFRNTPVKIHGSLHQPPEPAFVADEVQALCEYINENWAKSAGHLAAYVLWKMNWIHPFADGNGRTARAVSYVVLSIKLDSLQRGPLQSRNKSLLTKTLIIKRLRMPIRRGPCKRSMCPHLRDLWATCWPSNF